MAASATTKLLLALALVTVHSAAAAGPTCASVKDLVLGSGHNIGGPLPSPTEAACCALCQHHAGCKAWTWHPSSSKTFPLKCLLHSDICAKGGSTCTIHEAGVISGVATARMPPGVLPPPPPTPPPAHSYPSAEAACAAFTTTTKIMLMHGFGWGQNKDGVKGIDGYTRNSGCGNACGRAYFRWDNGPQGFGDGSPAGNATQWPSTLNMAASWDPDLAMEWGTAMGEEFWGKGTNIQEGPGLNIARCDFRLISLSDFRLKLWSVFDAGSRRTAGLSSTSPVRIQCWVACWGSRSSTAYRKTSWQSASITSCKRLPPFFLSISPSFYFKLLQCCSNSLQFTILPSHVRNNQETDRSGGNMVCDEKTLMELYAPPFAAIADRVAGYMCSYNRVNGVYACENKDTLMKILKGSFNFTGFVVSDWVRLPCLESPYSVQSAPCSLRLAAS